MKPASEELKDQVSAFLNQQMNHQPCVVIFAGKEGDAVRVDVIKNVKSEMGVKMCLMGLITLDKQMKEPPHEQV